jgi:hypothetical protein
MGKFIPTEIDGTFKLHSGYSRDTTVKKFRKMTIGEAKNLNPGDHIPFIDKNGNYRTVKVNGKPRIWKRTPARVIVPVKYGMYEYAALEGNGKTESDHIDCLLVEVN